MAHHNINIISNDEGALQIFSKYSHNCSLKFAKINKSVTSSVKFSYDNLLNKNKVLILYNSDSTNDSYYYLLSNIDTSFFKYITAAAFNRDHPNVLRVNINSLYEHEIFAFLGMSLSPDSSQAFNNDMLSFVKNNKPKLIVKSKGLMKHKRKDDCDQNLVLDIVKELYLDTNNIIDAEYGSKNLIYYSVFGSEYSRLLELSLQTIKQHSTKPNFDILIICDKNTQQIISNYNVVQYFNIIYHTIDTPSDGIESSIQKCKIFEYQNINEYNKILFLDCDIMAIKDVNIVFDQSYQSNILYTLNRQDLGIYAHNFTTHGLSNLSSDELNHLLLHNQQPFNAGQFLFKNSARMQQHFKNVMWFINNWCGEYFFEQCFMVHYFARNILTNNLLNTYILLIIAHLNKQQNKLQSNNQVLIHFAGNTLDATKKIEYIKQYFEKNNL